MPRVWRKLRSLFASENIGQMAPSPPRPRAIPVVALIVSEEDRREVSRACEASVKYGGNVSNGTSDSNRAGGSNQQGWQVHFADSCEQAAGLATQLSAPLILLDRDWPGTDWKATVELLAALPHHACVILVSGVADGYLWQEVVRREGYDVLAKPLRAENVLRALRLALSYWAVRAHQTVVVAGVLRK